MYLLSIYDTCCVEINPLTGFSLVILKRCGLQPRESFLESNLLSTFTLVRLGKAFEPWLVPFYALVLSRLDNLIDFSRTSYVFSSIHSISSIFRGLNYLPELIWSYLLAISGLILDGLRLFDSLEIVWRVATKLRISTAFLTFYVYLFRRSLLALELSLLNFLRDSPLGSLY